MITGFNIRRKKSLNSNRTKLLVHVNCVLGEKLQTEEKLKLEDEEENLNLTDGGDM
jgi:hypothetical protein